MNAKKVEEEKPKRNLLSALVSFFGSLKQELKQISWTNKKDLKKYTKIVLGSTFTVGLLIYIVDMGIQKCLSLVHFIIQRIFG